MGSVNNDITVTLEEVKKSTPEGNDPRPNSSTKRKRKRKPITEERKLQEMERLRNYRKKAKEEKEILVTMVKELQAKLSEPVRANPPGDT
ncbi:unnamed protein product [Allacma fusca]|uniref:Uncharacterized protein n=1 Tax=Allacma fusca TaxID=39272 RepID=A0A8J2NHF8_9HEXA|nr:unnamed protein product [Allacma fusca]